MAKRAGPAGSDSQTPPTDAVRAAERSSGGSRQGHETGVNRKENVDRLHVTGYFKNAEECATNKPLRNSSRV